MVKINAIEKMEIKIHGPHQAALRRRSVKVFDGAMKVLTMRDASDIGGATGDGTGADATGGIGALAMNYLQKRIAQILSVSERRDKKRRGANFRRIQAAIGRARI